MSWGGFGNDGRAVDNVECDGKFPLSHFDFSFSPSSGQAENTCNESTVFFLEEESIPAGYVPGQAHIIDIPIPYDTTRYQNQRESRSADEAHPYPLTIRPFIHPSCRKHLFN